jgi:phage tail sheath protein FI
MDVVGICGPCNTADPYTFPFDTPVLVFSNDTLTLAKLSNPATGISDGYIMDAVNGINDQLADFQQAAQLVIVITRYGTSGVQSLQLQQTIANLMGSSGTGTGIWALLKAPMTLYCTPRLITCPGYTGQMANSLDLLTVNIVGKGYIPGGLYTLTFAPGAGETNGANLVLPQAHAIADQNGTIDNPQVFIDTFGAWFTVAPTCTIVTPDGPPITAQPASGSIVFSTNPGIGSTITLGGTVVTFVSAGATGPQVNLGPNLAVTLTNLQTFLSGSADVNISKCTYTILQGTLNIIDKTAGSAGNGFGLASTVYGASLSGANLSGGSDAVAATRATFTTAMALGANPVCASLTPVLNQLIGHAVVEGPGTSAIADENWRTTMNSQRLIPMAGGVKIIDPVSGSVIIAPVAPRVIGCIVAEDFRTGYPFHSCANRPIQGIVGQARIVNFTLTDGANEGQVLLAANLGIVVRGLVGVETSISSGGFILITTDNCGDDPLWQMWNVKRGRDYIHLSLMPALRVYLGRNVIDRQTITNVLITIRDFLSSLKARQQILGYDVSFQGDLNTADQIRLGHLTVSFAAEEPPVLKLITTMSARYKPAIDAMVAQLAQQLNFSEV